MPLIAYQDLSVFKLFLVDLGLLAAMTNIHICTLISDVEWNDSIWCEM